MAKHTPTPYDTRIADPDTLQHTKRKLRQRAEGYRRAMADGHFLIAITGELVAALDDLVGNSHDSACSEAMTDHLMDDVAECDCGLVEAQAILSKATGGGE
jgi:hypothetical protein